jgi:hypothetical protein
LYLARCGGRLYRLTYDARFSREVPYQTYDGIGGRIGLEAKNDLDRLTQFSFKRRELAQECADALEGFSGVVGHGSPFVSIKPRNKQQVLLLHRHLELLYRQPISLALISGPVGNAALSQAT